MALRPPGLRSGSGHGDRYRAVVLTVLLLGSVVAGTAGGAAVISGDGVGSPGGHAGLADGAVASCTTIDEPGRYELVADVAAASGPCIHVRADDVVLDGNGHSVRATAGGADVGVGVGVGVLVFNGSVAGGEYEPAEPEFPARLTNVTVRDLRSENWTTGVQLGEPLELSGPTATLRNVTASGNGNGVESFGNEDVVLRDVTAARNDGDGVVLWETRDVAVADLTLRGNADRGAFLRETRDSTIESVATTGNGDAGLYFGIGSGNNTVVDARSVDNDGAGIAFGDSFDNVVRNATILDNAGPGVFSDPAADDLVEDSTVAGNAVAYRKRYFDSSFYGVIADEMVLASGTTVSFDTEVAALDDREHAPKPPEGATVVGPASNLTVVEDETANASFTVPYDPGLVDADESVALWHYGNGSWDRLASTVDRDAETVGANASNTGVVVPLATAGGGPGPGPGAGDPSTFVVDSTGDGTEFAYGFVVDGTIEKAHGNVSADAEEHVEVREDGRMVALGSTGDGYGDAFEVTGEIESFDYFPKDGDVRLLLDGRDVTAELNCTKTVVAGGGT